ncbi:MIP/aquaporin family protein [Mycetocola miduiensis]|uniref:Arsenate reductase n=1 Tax=Mycetocola miduiensis TaxID=995034 RepID=A0A1I4ZKY1_9MICO|nr:MIP/aquaporin family protein [Mycetocola miduiensis]SFN50904.1 arsenate reductase [Mycetocola miduiensis]
MKRSAHAWARPALAEFLGSALLTALVIGSGIAASTLSPGDTGLQLLENAFATALGLFALILIFGPASGAHFNPVVSLADAALGYRPWRDVGYYVPVQILGCIAGAVLANSMFGVPTTFSTTDRMTGPHFLAEIVATAGLILVIFSLARTGRSALAPAAVGAYIGAAYFFTSSASFANPAITIGRVFSDTFAGIAATSVPGYVVSQFIGVGLGLLVIAVLYPRTDTSGAPAAKRTRVASTRT